MLRALPVVLLLALVGLFVWQAAGLSGEPAVYPQILIGLLSVSLLIFFVQELRAGRLGAGFLSEVIPQSRAGSLRQAGFLGIWITYVLALPQLGFILATWAALTASWKIVGKAGWIRTLSITAVFTLVLAVLLKTVFFVPVPQGLLDQRLDEFVFSLEHGD